MCLQATRFLIIIYEKYTSSNNINVDMSTYTDSVSLQCWQFADWVESPNPPPPKKSCNQTQGKVSVAVQTLRALISLRSLIPKHVLCHVSSDGMNFMHCSLKYYATYLSNIFLKNVHVKVFSHLNHLLCMKHSMCVWHVSGVGTSYGMLIFFTRVPPTLTSAAYGHGHVGSSTLPAFIYSYRKTRSVLTNSVACAKHHLGKNKVK